MIKIRIDHTRHSGGFSLIELMIVVAIVAIITAVAFPSYQRYVVESRRTDGKELATDIAARLEQFYLQNSTYTVNIAGAAGLNTSVTSTEGYYTAAVAAGPSCGNIANCFVLSVTALGTQNTNDPDCRVFRIDNLGTKTALNSNGANSTDCW